MSKENGRGCATGDTKSRSLCPPKTIKNRKFGLENQTVRLIPLVHFANYGPMAGVIQFLILFSLFSESG